MKKALLYLLAFAFLSCLSDDENAPIPKETFINFNLNGIDYSLTEYSVTLDTTDTNLRRIEATFDDNTKTLLFFVIVEETNQIGEFILIENDTYHSSDVNFGDRETSITTHTDSKMEGTFRVTTDHAFDKAVYVFTNGIIDIEF
jgi:hypothetical protein